MAQINLTRNQRRVLENFRNTISDSNKPSTEEMASTIDLLAEIVLDADDQRQRESEPY